MVRSLLVSGCMALILVVGGCQSGGHGDRERTMETISVDQVPAQVRAGFEKEYPGARVHEVKKETYRNGLVHYEFEFTTADGKKMEVEVDEDGEVLEAH